MMQQGVDVNLPKASTSSLEGREEQIVVSISKDGEVYIGSGNTVELDQLALKIKAIMIRSKGAKNKVYALR